MPYKDPIKRKECAKKIRQKYENNPKNKYKIKKRARDKIYWLKSKYGLTIEQYDIILESQNGVCKICGGANPKRFAVDHDHKTGKIRGLLCSMCNGGLGLFRDNIDFLKKAIEYLK